MSGQDATERAERTFEALPPEHARSSARTWWGRAWLKALEDTALDGQQVKAGRRHARAGAVGAVSVRPGRVTAVVRDRDGTPYRADVVVQEFGAADWERLLELVAGQAGHIAALLDRDIPPHLAEDALAAGVELLPGIGDLEPECTCGAWDHCAHTAALCHQMALLLDQDPFVLLLMRGRGERELLEQLQARNAARGSGGGPGQDAGAPSGVSAAEAFATASFVAPLPDAPPAVEGPARPPVLSGDVAPAPGLDPAALEFLVADAAARARQLLAEALATGHEGTPVAGELTLWEDAVRLAAAGADDRVTARLAEGCGRERAELARAVRAWEYGGPASLAVLEEEWTPEGEGLARARARLTGAWEEEQAPQLRAERNRWTAVGTSAQLRYGRDGWWWPYRKEGGRWLPAGPCDHDPAAALAALLTDDR
ncbi:SWF or SNF family helicase [Streptomyces telluris]|uniref:SWF or SNF family helicase n=1 Tax=Streptomyces telluris TaxID=2720021 RepID=A0A9X2LE54_9ACTN|nr:SWF or SNF family helicase [Streptomyces telluris]MCQ8769667.1 SWF or SNF family helicase [Streptomyces telluris]NJP77717.1 SWF or SNF family helicase [Streptomyces telluris]